ncbi:MAG: VOC family protein [Candidatus Manganitrophaceae bacterium]
MTTQTTHCTPTPHLETGHVGLNVTDLDRSKKFYQEVFGLELMGESSEADRRFAFLGDGKRRLLTLWQQSQGRFEKGLPGLHHLSFQAVTIEEVERLQERLRGLKISFLYDGVVPHAEGTESGGIFFEDPDGIRLEIYAPTGAGCKTPPTPGAPSCGFF